MSRRNFLKEAEQCRVRARVSRDGERELLLKLAAAFEEIAQASEARQAVAETRCW